MTARIVIFSTVHAARVTPRFHRESIPGIPACGVPLRNPHRAITVDDQRLCASCWGGVSDAENPSNPGRIGATTKAAPAVRKHCDPGPSHDAQIKETS